MESGEVDEKTPTFSLGEPVSPARTEKQQDDADQPKQKSRFKVAKVEFKDSPILVDSVDDQIECKQKPTVKIVGSDGTSESPGLTPYQTDTYHSPSYMYDTHNLKTFGCNTLETLPHADHYRNLLSATGAMKKRPTLLELHDLEQGDGDILLQDAENGIKTEPLPHSFASKETKPPPTAGPKFGWIKGVLVRCLLNIYGVMLFLRLSWVVGQAGMGFATLVILLSAVVTIITTLSMSAICTNGEIKGGGAYFMISRSLGPEFGGAIGMIFSLANAVATAMYVVGFAETIRDILAENNALMTDEINDVRIIGLITVCFLLAIALIGMEWEARAQLILLAILIIAMINFAIGSFIPPNEAKQAKGIVGFKGEVLEQNIGPDFRDGENFFSVFSIFFPAATGILAGANISGDLVDAQAAIPKGTLLAIAISTVTYIVMAWMAGSCTLRDAFGHVGILTDSQIINETFSAFLTTPTMFTNFSSYEYTVEDSDILHASKNVTLSGMNHKNGLDPVCNPGECKYGLQNDMQVMQLISAWGPITIAGIISATLSSALASLVSAPKVFQAVCKDKIFPYIHFFAKGYGKGEEPRRSYLLAFGIAVACICIGQLNAIAPLISNFFLMSYALINYSCFDASLAKSPGWRPAFKYYSMWMSLIGAVLCLGVMFVINWWTALITLALVVFLYVYVHYQKPDINWGSSTQAHVYRNALQHNIKLVSVMDHVKNFRPQMLVLSGYPSDRPALIDLASSITKNISLMICAHISVGDTTDRLKDPRSLSRQAYQWLHKRKVKAFYCHVMSNSMRSGAQSLLQCGGLGKMRPNTLLLGFKSDWSKCSPDEVEEYVNIIHDAFDLHYGVGVLCLKEGLDYSHLTHGAAQEDPAIVQNNKENYSSGTANPVSKTVSIGPTVIQSQVISNDISTPKDPDGEQIYQPNLGAGDTLDVLPLESSPLRSDANDDDNESVEDEGNDEEMSQMINKEAIKNLNRFYRKQKKGTIDVWWMFDDGGLTLLIPYILSTKKHWANCKLRVFMAGTKSKELDRDQRNMATLLSKFRIEYSSMTVIPTIGKIPHEQNRREFESLIKDCMLDSAKGETSESFPWKISKHELSAQKDKTNRHIRLRELLLEHSNDATLIVMTLPMPKRGLCSPSLYMAWLDTITKDMPPILLLRGNQDSVLTYYS